MPDLIAVPASELSIHVNKKTGIRRLRFTSSLGNVGVGPIEVRPNQKQPCPVGQRNSTQIVYRDLNVDGVFKPLIDTSVFRHRAGCMIYHPTASPLALQGVRAVRPVRPQRRPAGRGQHPAQGELLPAGHRPAAVALRVLHLPRRRTACARARSPQGISVGWMDIYQSFLPGQSLVLPPGLPNGLYCLTTVVDPIDQLLEVEQHQQRRRPGARASTATGSAADRRPGAPERRSPR